MSGGHWEYGIPKIPHFSVQNREIPPFHFSWRFVEWYMEDFLKGRGVPAVDGT